MRRKINLWTPFFTLFLLLGCGGAAPPDRQMVSAEAAIRAAQELGAPNVPQASLSLRQAVGQVDKAKALMRDGNNARAAMMLARAQVDAELAIALTKENTAKAEAQEAEDTVVELKNKMKSLGR
ncbi:MAG: DUF4398 domain-containing protein [Deltaproteobacteria bacterium]|nr:DUF4398 domain-containing protein [Deltaproteobacteria bacterium]